MAEKVKMSRQLAGPLLPAVRVEKKQQQQARASLPLPAVVLVSLWGLLNAAAVALNLILFLVLCVINPCVPSWMLPPPDEPRDAAEDARATALMLGFFWGSVPQAAAATLALALALAARRRRVRRALACAVLAAAVASRCMYAAGVGIRNVTQPGYHAFVRINWAATIFLFAVGNLVCLLALLVGSNE